MVSARDLDFSTSRHESRKSESPIFYFSKETTAYSFLREHSRHFNLPPNPL